MLNSYNNLETNSRRWLFAVTESFSLLSAMPRLCSHSQSLASSSFSVSDGTTYFCFPTQSTFLFLLFCFCFCVIAARSSDVWSGVTHLPCVPLFLPSAAADEQRWENSCPSCCTLCIWVLPVTIGRVSAKTPDLNTALLCRSESTSDWSALNTVQHWISSESASSHPSGHTTVRARLPVCMSVNVCVSKAPMGCVFAGSTALDLQNIERSRLCGGKLAESAGGPMLRNSGGGRRTKEILEIPTSLSTFLSILFKMCSKTPCAQTNHSPKWYRSHWLYKSKLLYSLTFPNGGNFCGDKMWHKEKASRCSDGVAIQDRGRLTLYPDKEDARGCHGKCLFSRKDPKNQGFSSVLLSSSTMTSCFRNPLPKWYICPVWWSLSVPLCPVSCLVFLSLASLIHLHLFTKQPTHLSLSFILLPSWTWKAQSIDYSISINYKVIVSSEEGVVFIYRRKMDPHTTYYIDYKKMQNPYFLFRSYYRLSYNCKV